MSLATRSKAEKNVCVGGFIYLLHPLTRHLISLGGSIPGCEAPLGAGAAEAWGWDAGLLEGWGQPEMTCDSWPWAISGFLARWALSAVKPRPPSEVGLLVTVA